VGGIRGVYQLLVSMSPAGDGRKKLKKRKDLSYGGDGGGRKTDGLSPGLWFGTFGKGGEGGVGGGGGGRQELRPHRDHR